MQFFFGFVFYFKVIAIFRPFIHTQIYVYNIYTHIRPGAAFLSAVAV